MRPGDMKSQTASTFPSSLPLNHLMVHQACIGAPLKWLTKGSKIHRVQTQTASCWRGGAPESTPGRVSYLSHCSGQCPHCNSFPYSAALPRMIPELGISVIQEAAITKTHSYPQLFSSPLCPTLLPYLTLSAYFQTITLCLINCLLRAKVSPTPQSAKWFSEASLLRLETHTHTHTQLNLSLGVCSKVVSDSGHISTLEWLLIMRLPPLSSLVPPLFAEEAVGGRLLNCVLSWAVLGNLCTGGACPWHFLPRLFGFLILWGWEERTVMVGQWTSSLSITFILTDGIAGGNRGGEHEVARDS